MQTIPLIRCTFHPNLAEFRSSDASFSLAQPDESSSDVSELGRSSMDLSESPRSSMRIQLRSQFYTSDELLRLRQQKIHLMRKQLRQH
jgi:hypothetical protein